MEEITLYPSSWYYNACVYGFLEVLEYGLKNGVVEEELIETSDGTNAGAVVIPQHILEQIYSPSRQLGGEISSSTELSNLAWWWVSLSADRGFINKSAYDEWKDGNSEPSEMMNAVFGNLLAGPTSNYRSLGQSQWSESEKIAFLNHWFSFDHEDATGIRCGFCGTRFKIEPQERYFNRFFTMSMASNLGLSVGKFPNLTWDYNPNLPVCKTCRSQFLFFHLVRRNRFFINTDSHAVNWHLNHLVRNKLQQKHSPFHHALLEGMKLDPQLRQTLGAWGMQKIEMIQFNREEVDYYQIPLHLSNLFLIPEVAYLIGSITNKLALDYIFKGQHESVLDMIYKSIREELSGKKGNDPEAKLTSSETKSALQLYQHIQVNQNLSGKGGVRTVNLRELSECAANAPRILKDNKSGLVFRLLELTRMGKKEDVYHLLLRAYVAESKTFPLELRTAFTVQDPLFKNSIYAFIASLTGKMTDFE
jgi:CRISPR-associated protein Cst1